MKPEYNIPQQSQEKNEIISSFEGKLSFEDMNLLESWKQENASYFKEKPLRVKRVIRKTTQDVGLSIIDIHNKSKEELLVMYRGLTKKRKEAFRYLIFLSNNYRMVFPSQTTIAGHADLERQAINIFMAYLYEHGWLIKIKKKWFPCLYELNPVFFKKEVREFLSTEIPEFKNEVKLDLEITWEKLVMYFRYSFQIKAFLKDLFPNRTLSILKNYYYNNYVYFTYNIYIFITGLVKRLKNSYEIYKLKQTFSKKNTPFDNKQENLLKQEDIKSYEQDKDSLFTQMLRDQYTSSWNQQNLDYAPKETSLSNDSGLSS